MKIFIGKPFVLLVFALSITIIPVYAGQGLNSVGNSFSSYQSSLSAESFEEGYLFLDTGPGSVLDPPDGSIIRTRTTQMNNLLLTQNSQEFWVNLFDDVILEVVFDRNEMVDSSYTWIGHVQGESLSQVIFSSGTFDTVEGVITYPGGVFEIHQYDESTCVINQISQAYMPEDAPPYDESIPEEELEVLEVSTDPGNNIDVAVFYTETARNSAGSVNAMDQRVNLMFQETNQSFINSNILVKNSENVDVFLRLQQVYKGVITYAESGNLGTDVSRLQNTSDGYIDSVHTIRDQVGADIVVLIVDNGGGYCSRAHGIMSPVSTSFASRAFAVVDLECATGYYSFAYAIGQIMGARSDWYTDSTDNAPYTYNHGYANPQKAFRTIMGLNSYCLAQSPSVDCTRLAYWSSPTMNTPAAYGSVPLGTSTANNRQTLMNTAPTVAKFRQSISQIPPAASLLAPVGNPIVSDLSVTFQWNVVDLATSYLLTINGSTNHNEVIGTSACDVNTQICSHEVTLAEGDYTWSITASNSYGQSQATSDTFRLIPLPGQPILQSPTTAISITKPTFQWTEVNGAVDYLISVSGPSGFSKGWSAFSCVDGICSYTPPALLAGGSYSWKVQARNEAGTGLESSIANFMVTVPNSPVLISPTGSDISFIPTYTWEAVSGADAYRVNVTGSAEYSYTSDWISGTSLISPVSFLGGEYSWKVQGKNSVGEGSWSNPITFTVSLPSTPTISEPGENASFQTSPQTMNWVAVDGVVGYELDISTYPTGSEGPYLHLTDNSYSYEFTSGTYYWRVRGYNLSGTGNWSSIRSFSSEPPDPPLSSSPEGMIYTNAPTYAWSSVSGQGTIEYQVIVERLSDSVQVYNSGWILSTSQQQPTALPIDTYRWKVQSRGDFGTSAYSDWKIFTLQGPGTVTTMIGPNSTVYINQPVFSWNKITGSTQYKISLTGPNNYSYESPDWISCTSDVCTTTIPELPANVVGEYQWKVKAWNVVGEGDWSSSTIFNTSAPSVGPTLSSPISGNIYTNQPTFTWLDYSDYGKILQYDLQIGSDPVINNVGSCGETTCSYVLVDSLTAGTYQWKIRATNAFGSAWSNLATMTISEPMIAPIQVSPIGNIYTTQPSYSWNTVTGNGVITGYQFQLDTGDIVDIPTTACSGNTCTYTPEGMLNAVMHTWKVRAKNNVTGGTAVWATTSFTPNGPQSAPTAVSPSGNVYIQNPTFTWNVLTGNGTIINYYFELRSSTDTLIDSATISPSACTTTCSYTPASNVLTAGVISSYTWKVKAENEIGSGVWGSTSITTSVPISISQVTPISPDGKNLYEYPTFTFTIPSSVVISEGITDFAIAIKILGGDELNDSTFPKDLICSGTSTLTCSGQTSGIVVIPGTTYVWKIKAINAFGKSGPNGNMKFVPKLPSIPTALTPATNTSTQPNYIWDISANTDQSVRQYHIQVLNDDDSVRHEGYVAGSNSTASHGALGWADLPSGTYKWKVSAINDYGESAFSPSKTFTVAVPSIPAGLSPTSNIFVNSGITFYWNVANGATGYDFDFGGVITESVGSCTATVCSYTPSSTYTAGTYSWGVRAKNGVGTSNWSTATVTITAPTTAPTLSTPSTGTFVYTNPRSFTWVAVSNQSVSSYLMSITPSEGVVITYPMDRTQTGATVTFTNVGTYTWQVAAVNSLGTGVYSVTRTVIVSGPAAPTLSTTEPSPSGTIYYNNPTYSWGSVTGQGTITYALQVDRETSIGSGVWNTIYGDPLIWQSSRTLVQSPVLEIGSYRWRVVAQSSYFGQGTWSAYKTFTVNAPTSAPTLTMPAAASTITSNPTVFSWSTIANQKVTSYELLITPSTDVTITYPSDRTQGNASVNFTTSGNYTWQVRGINPVGNGPWSTETRSFTVQAPSAPTLLNPANSSKVFTQSQILSWSSVAGATEYEVELTKPDLSTTNISTASTSTEVTLTQSGVYSWRVRILVSEFGPSGWGASRSFTVSVPTSSPGITSPIDQTIYLTTVDITWSAVTGEEVEGYSLEITDPLNNITTTQHTGTSASGVTLPLSGVYSWRVQAYNHWGAGVWSNKGVFTVSSPTTAPILTSPSTSVTLVNTSVTFTWSAISNQNVNGYDLEITSPIGNSVESSHSSTSVSNVQLTLAGTYSWRVRANNTWGKGVWSEPSTLVMSVPQPPALSLPVDQSTIYVTDPTFKWESIDGATAYRLVVNGTGDTSYTYDSGWTTELVNQIPALNAPGAGTYVWRVISKNLIGESEASVEWAFNLNVPGAIPGLTSPVSVSIKNNHPSYTWQQIDPNQGDRSSTLYRINVVGPNNYEFQSDWTSELSYQPPAITAPAAGEYTWKVQTRGDAGEGAWSSPGVFTIVVPGAATLSSPPDGALVYTNTPVYQWNAVADATAYRIIIQQPVGTTIHTSDWLSSNSICTDGVCSKQLLYSLNEGAFSWLVQTSSSVGEGIVSTASDFQTSKPGQVVTITSPSQDEVLVVSNLPEIIWTAVAGATKYYLQIVDDRPDPIDKIEVSAISACSDGTCHYQLTDEQVEGGLVNGEVQLVIQTWNIFGYGLTSSVRSFSVDFTPAPPEPGLKDPIPDSPVVTSPNGNTSLSKTKIIWTRSLYADEYYILIRNASTKAKIIEQWYLVEDTNCDDTFCYIVLTSELPGATYNIWMRAKNLTGISAFSVKYTFTVVAPTKAPSGLSVSSLEDNRPLFAWNTIEGATQYNISIYYPGTTLLTKFTIDSGTSCVVDSCSYEPNLFLQGGDYSWTVRGKNAAGSGIVSEKNTFSAEPGKPVLLPFTGEISVNFPVFKWYEVINSTAYSIRVRDVITGTILSQKNSVGDGNLVCVDGICQVKWQGTGLTKGEYTFQVKAYKTVLSDTAAGSWSDRSAFIVIPPSESSPTGPMGNISSNTPEFSWTVSSGALKYYLFIEKVSGTTTTLLFRRALNAITYCGDDICSFTPSDLLLNGGSYRWYVQSWSYAGKSPKSAYTYFTTEPGKVVFVDPVKNSTIRNTKPTFRWNIATGATGYYIIIKKSDGTLIYKQKFSVTDTSGLVCDDSICLFRPSNIPEFRKGEYILSIKAYKKINDTTSVYGPSIKTVFYVMKPAQAVAEVISPLGDIDTNYPVFEWKAAPNATKYLLTIIDQKGDVIYKVIKKSSQICSGDVNDPDVDISTITCSIQYPTPIAGGTYQWVIRPGSAAGWGPVGNLYTFNTEPEKVTIISLNKKQIYSDTSSGYQWTEANGATAYHIYIYNRTLGVTLLQQTYPVGSSDLTCADGICTLLIENQNLRNSDYMWKVYAIKEIEPGVSVRGSTSSAYFTIKR